MFKYAGLRVRCWNSCLVLKWQYQTLFAVCLQVYHWTGENSYFVKGNTDSLQMGGGGYGYTVSFLFYIGNLNPLTEDKDCFLTLCPFLCSGKLGLWLNAELYRGTTTKCATFNNQPLSTQQDFNIHSLEVWTFE